MPPLRESCVLTAQQERVSGPARVKQSWSPGIVVVLHVCVCVHSCGGAQMGHSSAWRSGAASGVGPCSPPCLKQDLSCCAHLDAPCAFQTSWPGSFLGELFLISIGVLDLQTQDNTPDFHTRSWDLNSGRQEWVASVFTTEPSPWPRRKILFVLIIYVFFE